MIHGKGIPDGGAAVRAIPGLFYLSHVVHQPSHVSCTAQSHIIKTCSQSDLQAVLRIRDVKLIKEFKYLNPKNSF
jgi:hypothetical protein